MEQRAARQEEAEKEQEPPPIPPPRVSSLLLCFLLVRRDLGLILVCSGLFLVCDLGHWGERAHVRAGLKC